MKHRRPPRNQENGLFSSRSRGERTAIEGAVERITYVNEENGWSVIRLQPPDGGSLVPAVGILPGVRLGENIRVHGVWVVDRRYGEQFQVDSFVTVQPSTLAGIEKYLGSGMIKGFGKVTASRLVKRFGLDTLEVITRHPERLTEVEGIGPKRKGQITAAWAEQAAVREVMVFLQSHGVTAAFAAKIHGFYGKRSISIIRENPYRLAEDIPGIGFRTADRIAAALGAPPDSPRRAEAGVLYTLGELSSDGNLFAPMELLVERASQLLGVESPAVEDGVMRLAEEGRVVLESEDSRKPVYLTRFHEAECSAAERLREILEADVTLLPVSLDDALREFQEREGLFLAPPQREAVRKSASSKVLIITGGPGTGKTTIIKAILQVLGGRRGRISLCAPTGRAAKRLEEATGAPASTIHRLLEFNPRMQLFERNRDRPLNSDHLVVDEMSMVDAELFAALLDALPSSCALILVGDADQLPSVGPGNVLHDLIRSRVVEVVALTEIFRQVQESLIVVNAHRINRGEMPLLSPDGWEDPDFFFIERDDPREVVETLKELVSTRIPSRFGADPMGDIQVLTPMRRGELGTGNLNTQLQGLLNPEGDSVARGGFFFRTGDRVMQIRNNYDLAVFNGDLGRVEAIDEEDRTLDVRFDERSVTYDWADLDQLVLGYACSIHKSQGSEYPVVVMPLHTQHYILLQRNLLYTGITRGKKLVVVVGTKKALAIAVGNSRVKRRHTRFAERLSPGEVLVPDRDC